MADGKIIVETGVDTSGIKKGLNELERLSKASAGSVKNDLDGIGKSGGSTGNSLSQMGSRASGGLALVAGAAAAAGVAIIAFGKSAIEAAGSAKAIQSQFTQVFGELEPAAQQAVEKMAEKFGMVPNRLKPSMSQMTSMFKGLGLDTEAAMAKATDAVTASADAAAFYDVSYSDANSALTSFIKGNYEGGEAIGLFANDTQMAQYAIQKGLVGTTAAWSSLDEATKQATRLEYSQNMQKLAGATGQAARESDGLENQLGNVNQAWTDFMAIVGGPILGLAVGALKGLTSGLQLAGEGFKTLVASAQEMDFSGVADELEPFGVEFERVKMVAVGAFEEAKIKVMEVMPQIIEAVQPILGAFQSLWENIKPVFLYLVQTLYEDVIPALSAMFNAFMESLPAIINFLTPIYQVLTNVIGFVMNVIGLVVALLQGDWSTAWQFAGSAVQNVVNTIGSILNFLWSVITGIFSGIGTAIATSWQGIYDNGVTVWNSITSFLSGAVQSIYDNTIGKLVETAVGIATKWDEMKETAGTKWEEIKTTIMTTVQNLPTDLKNIAIDMITKVGDGIRETAENVYGAITGLAGQVLEKFRKALGINSPSTELFDIGKYMMQGLINGLNGDSLMSFVGKMVEDLKNAFSSGNLSLKAAIDFVGTGAAEFFKSIGIGGASLSGLTSPVNGSITSGFGGRDSPTEGASSNHAGIDIGASEGTPVGAAGAGEVTYAGGDPNEGYGYHVIIDHGNGLETLYGHLSSVLVSVGQMVSQLETIGLVGSTGISTGPHLHFGVYQNGEAIDSSEILGSYANGTDRVPKTGLYKLHKDEAVRTVAENKLDNSLLNAGMSSGLMEKMQASVDAQMAKVSSNLSSTVNLKTLNQAPGSNDESKDRTYTGMVGELIKGVNELVDITKKGGNVYLDSKTLIGVVDKGLGTKAGMKGRMSAI
ncbi:peptidoglycan DD-metalloendopeptidase family protein [Acetobacterium bakii]|uniref:peptidoglycan DD-metalloendopeptidase family protein n=1 Tax=Acetobacterium bakii TaxID=52689 RepID=UPI000681E738|nr:peptidoglycan DD-metalloendopeptidase family protein [Acetobacterium bakii]